WSRSCSAVAHATAISCSLEFAASRSAVTADRAASACSASWRIWPRAAFTFLKLRNSSSPSAASGFPPFTTNACLSILIGNRASSSATAPTPSASAGRAARMARISTSSGSRRSTPLVGSVPWFGMYSSTRSSSSRSTNTLLMAFSLGGQGGADKPLAVAAAKRRRDVAHLDHCCVDHPHQPTLLRLRGGLRDGGGACFALHPSLLLVCMKSVVSTLCGPDAITEPFVIGFAH